MAPAYTFDTNIPSTGLPDQSQHAPVLEEGLFDVNVTEGHSITLTCRISDADTITWYKDDNLQRPSQDFKQSYDGCVAKLEICEVFLDDVGEYACVAHNNLGEVHTACQISVTGRLTSH